MWPICAPSIPPMPSANATRKLTFESLEYAARADTKIINIVKKEVPTVFAWYNQTQREVAS